MRIITTAIAGVILVSMLCGCAVIMKNSKKERQLFTAWGEENKRQNQAFGERVYDKDFDLVFTAVITGLADIGFSIRNMERQSGYILAEGPSPLSDEELNRHAEGMVQELNRVSAGWYATPGNAKKAATITVLRFGNGRTKVKMRISTADIKTNNASTIYSGTYPPILESEYKATWRALERQIFLDEHLDGTNSG